MAKNNDLQNLEKKFNMVAQELENSFEISFDSKRDSISERSSGEKNKSVFSILYFFISQLWSLSKSITSFIVAKFSKILILISFYSKKVSIKLDDFRDKDELNTKNVLKKSSNLTEDNFFKSNLEKSKAEKIKIEYASKLTNTFGKSFCTSVLDYEAEYSENIRHTVDYQAELMSYVATKLIESKLILNVSVIKITLKPTLDEEKVDTTIEFTVDNNGCVWSKIFSNFITKSLTESLDLVEGNVLGLYQSNLTLKTETFSLFITHKILSEHVSFGYIKTGLRERRENDLVV